MAKFSTRLKHSTRNSSSGFSIFEMLVASVMSSIILGFSLSVIVQQRRVFQIDQARGLLNQNLRSASDLIGADIKQGGEWLATNFSVPTFSIINGGVGEPDTLSIQRKLIGTDQRVLQAVPIGASYAVVGMGNASSINTTINAWEDDLDNANSTLPAVAFIFDTSQTATLAARRGEFFVYTSHTTSGPSSATEFRINRSGTFVNAYSMNTSFIYLLEERTYSLVEDPNDPETYILQLQVNRGVNPSTPGTLSEPRSIANGLKDFQVQAVFPSATKDRLNEGGTYETTIDPIEDPDWRSVRFFSIRLTSNKPIIYDRLRREEKDRFFGDCMTSVSAPTCVFSLTSQFLPRNTISTQ